MTRPSAPASQRTSSWRGTSSRRTVGPGSETVPAAGVGAAQLGRAGLVSFVGFVRAVLRAALFGEARRLQYYTMTAPSEPEPEVCDVCGSTDLWWRNCKLLCRRCRHIVKSCADL
jgi:hypothetical protein